MKKKSSFENLNVKDTNPKSIIEPDQQKAKEIILMNKHIIKKSKKRTSLTNY